MKKNVISIILVMALIFLLGTTVVLADMGAPGIDVYTAYISNIDGANAYEYSYDGDSSKLVKKRTVDYKTEIQVSYEFSDEGVNYVSTEIDGDVYYIKAEDISTDEIYEKDIDVESKVYATIIKEGGVDLCEGPGYGYSKVTTIPKDTEITAYYSEGITDSWVYTEYDGEEGWLCILNGAVGFENDYYEKIFTFQICKIYDDVTFENEIGEIPVNTKITDFLSTDDWSRGLYLTYGDVSGYVSCYDVAMQFDNFSRYVPSGNTLKLYEEADETSAYSYDGTITDEQKESLVVLYEQFDIREGGWYYIVCDSIKGWIYNDDFENIVRTYTGKVTNEDGAVYYKMEEYSYDEDALKEAGTLDFEEEIEVSWESILGNNTYAVFEKDGEEYYVKKADLENLNLKAANIIDDDEVEEEVEIEDDEEIELSNEMSPTTIVIICVVVAVVAFLLIVVILVLSNKKKKNQE